MKGKKILLTGGAGFIGSHIAEAVLKLGITKLIIIDNLSTGNIDNLKTTGILDDERVVFFKEDISDFDVLRKILQSEPDIDIICHQAALGSIPRSIQNPLASHHSNVDGFFNMLEIARTFGIKRFVYASSSSVYGDSKVLPKVEFEVGDVISPYAATKKINEIYANVFTMCYDMECIGLRYFNVFGPRQTLNGPYAAVIPRFAMAIKENQSPTIYGDGNQSRDFTFVENAVKANILAMTVGYNNRVFGKVYNVATGSRINLNNMYNMMQEITHTSLEPIYTESRKGDIEHSWANISNTQEMLGYMPSVNFKDGIKITLNYYMGL